MHKKTIFLLVCIVLSSLFTEAQKSKQYESTKKTITVKTEIYCDHCVTCESCKARVEKKVLELKGIRSVEMNPKTKKIKVIYNPKFIDAKKIKEQIASSGYDADEIKATKEQKAELGRCCQKQKRLVKEK